MITGFFLTVVYLFSSFVLSLLPDGSLGISQGFIDAFTLIVGYVNAYSWLLPVDQLFYALLFVLGIELAILAFRLGLWLLNLIRRT